jgi:hypothetical protein
LANSIELGRTASVELWVFLASLLRGHTVVHGLNGDRQATVEQGEEEMDWSAKAWARELCDER